MKKSVFSVVLAAVILSVTSLYAAERAVEAEGESVISRDDAIRQAQRSAVELSAGVFINSRTEVENFEVKKDRILARTQGYVTRFTVLKAETTPDGHRVKIRAVISLDKIKDDLLAMKILLDSMERPKVVVLIGEKYVGMDDIGMRLAETEISSLLAAKGLDLVDQAQVEKIKSLDQARQALAGNMAAAQRLGLGLGAQYMILGEARVQDSGEAFPGTGLKSLQASMQLKILQIQTGLVLGSVVKNAVAAHVSPLTGATKALRVSAQKAVDEYLVDTITGSFQDYLNNGAPLKLQITGVGTFSMNRAVADTIAALDRVVSAKQDDWSKVGGLLALDLRFKGTSADLAEMLDGLDLEGRQLEVVDLGPDRVDCTLK